MKINTNRLAAYVVCASLSLASLSAAFADTVVVRPGDTVIKIAERELGNRNRFTEICRLNRRVLGGDCDWITVGMVLELPTRVHIRKAAVLTAASVSQGFGDSSTLKGDFVARFTRSSGQTLNAPAGYAATPADIFVQLSGHAANASSGGKPGIWLQVPDSIEKAASGNVIIVDALVRMATGGGPIGLAYSTNEVGNSGWRTQEAGTEFKTVSFTYQVPPMKNGGGDYIGILPDPENTHQVLYVAEISLRVVAE